MPSKHLIPHIHNVRQLPNLCGPAALATVLGYWGIRITQEGIARFAFSQTRRSTHIADLAVYARAKGLRTCAYRGGMADLRRRASADVPVIVLQGCSCGTVSAHYRVAVGFDDERKHVLVFDPCKPGIHAVPYSTFDRLWRHQGRCMLVVAPRGRQHVVDATRRNRPLA